jgi:serine/threonine-protein phosphatase 6 regulatory ankyrin repeat subunit B
MDGAGGRRDLPDARNPLFQAVMVEYLLKRVHTFTGGKVSHQPRNVFADKKDRSRFLATVMRGDVDEVVEAYGRVQDELDAFVEGSTMLDWAALKGKRKKARRKEDIRNVITRHELMHLAYESMILGIMYGHLKVVQFFVTEIGLPAIPAVLKHMGTPLFLACQFGHADIARFLLNEGALINEGMDEDDATPLLVAAQEGHADVVKVLIDSGADVHKATTAGMAPLYEACFNNDAEIVDVLFEAGAGKDIPEKILHEMVLSLCHDGKVDMARSFLTRNHVDLNVVFDDQDGITMLCIDIQEGHLGIVRLLIELGADVNLARADAGATPLYIASMYGHTDIVNALLDAGASVHKRRTDSGSTPLFIASQLNHLAIVRLLVDAGADVNARLSKNGASPITVASQHGHTEVVRHLVSAGANVNMLSSEPMCATPLYLACQRGHLDVVRLLVAEFGADTSLARADTGDTPLETAQEHDYDDIVRFLEGHAGASSGQ